ncbi:MAG TPA: PEP-CTERM sorting domain-containing protein [Planctomycetota bacterium]|nr:PEP-CTERM sorting domain-containing protein [Planctomycetota bacterium]
MKAILTLALAMLLSAGVYAAPTGLTIEQTNKAVAADVLTDNETAGSFHGTEGGGGGAIEDPCAPVIPEPASMALLGIGLGLAALRRRK